MATRSKAHRTFRLLPARDLWLAALPFLPLVVLSAAVAGLVDPARQLAFLATEDAPYLAAPEIVYVHLGDMLTYYALAAVHVCICLGVIGWFVGRIGRLSPAQRGRAFAFLRSAFLVLLAIVAFFIAFADESTLVQLGFKATCMALEAARLPTALSGDGCFVPDGISTLTLLAWIPTFAGMAAVLFAAAFADGSVKGLPPRTDTAWRAEVDRRIAALERSVYALSAVLVSSTITITVFARLPLRLFAEDSAIGDAMAAYATGLSTFWGALFTLTLAATFAGPAWQMLRRRRGRGAGSEDADLGTWLQEHVLVTAKHHLINIVSLLAPLLVGPLGSLLSGLAGG